MNQLIFGFYQYGQFYWPKWPILLASVGVDKMLLYSSCIIQLAQESTTNQVKTVILQQC